MRVLITGVTGQVGRAICAQLAARHSVVGLSRKSAAMTGMSEHIALTLGSEDAIRRLERLTEPCDAIVHAAAAISNDLRDANVILTNVLGTQQVMEVALDWNHATVIFLSSVPVVGQPERLPITEDQRVAPATVYHASKAFGEHLMAIAARNGCRTVSLRLTSPTGPGTPDTRIVGAFVRRALAGAPLALSGRGTRRQNYVDVRDVAVAVEACLHSAAQGVYNIAAPNTISNEDLARTCVRALHSVSTIEWTGRADPEDNLLWDVDISKARRAFEYQPSFLIEDSIRALADEYTHSQ